MDVYNYPEYFALMYGMDVEDTKLVFQFFAFMKTDSIVYTEKVFVTVHLVASCLGLCTNLLTIILLMSIKGSLRSSLKLILSLAVSDCGRSICDVLMHYVQFDNHYSAGAGNVAKREDGSLFIYMLRRILSDMYILTDLSGNVMLIVFAVSIFLAVRKPFEYNRLMSKRRTGILIVFIWTILYFLVSVTTVAIEILRYWGNSNGYEYQKMYLSLREFNLFFILIVFIMNIAIVVEVKRQTVRSLSFRKQAKLAIVLGLIALCNLVLNVPIMQSFSNLISSGTDMKDMSLAFYMYYASYVAAALRSLVNSIIYAARLPEIQRQMKIFVCKKLFNWTHRSSQTGRSSVEETQ